MRSCDEERVCVNVCVTELHVRTKEKTHSRACVRSCDEERVCVCVCVCECVCYRITRANLRKYTRSCVHAFLRLDVRTYINLRCLTVCTCCKMQPCVCTTNIGIQR